jgi:hypothetical protein
MEDESTLPGEVIANRAGAPKEVSALLSVGDKNGLALFVDAKGNTHKETARAKAAFEQYLNMGRERSLEKLAREYADSENPDWAGMKYDSIFSTLRQFSTKLDWQNRIRLTLAADSAKALAAANRAAAQRTTARMGHAKLMQDVGASILKAAGLLDVENLSQEEARQLIKPAATLLQIGLSAEKAEIGESIQKITPHKPVHEMTDDELEQYIEVIRENLQ